MEEDDMVILLFGADLEDIAPNGSIKNAERHTQQSPLVYLALGVTGKDDYVLRHYAAGLPHRDLFFKCLRPWRWLSEETKDIVIDELNIAVNISEYYKIPRARRAMVNISDARRLSREKPDAATVKCITDKYYTHVISNGNKNIERILLCRYGDGGDCLFILIILGSTKLV